MLLILAVVITYLFASPYWVLYQMHRAIEHNQVDKIARYIDFPAVRSSLKPQVQRFIEQKLGMDKHQHIWGKWGSKLSEKTAEQAIEFAVNADSIALLMQGKQLKQALSLPEQQNVLQQLGDIFGQQYNPQLQQQFKQPLGSAQDQFVYDTYLIDFTAFNLAPALVQVSYAATETSAQPEVHYLAWNRFQLMVPNRAMQQTQFIFSRRGLTWKMTAIELGI